ALHEFIRQVPSQVLIALDEAYVEFLATPCDCLALIREGHVPNLLLLRTFSKIYGLAGLRVGYGIGGPPLVSALEKIRQPFNLNALAQAGALAALDDTEHLQRTLSNNRLGMELFERTFQDWSLRFAPSHANFILVEVGDGQRVFAELQQHGVI